MPKSTVIEMPPEGQTQMLAALRRARYGYVLTLHSVLWCAAGRTPTDIAAVLFCSRSSVYRAVRAYRAGTLALEPDDGRLSPPVRRPSWSRRCAGRGWPCSRRRPGPSWCRTRWSGATLAATFEAKRGLTVSAATMRRWVREVGWVWKRAKFVAKDDDPHRVKRLARIRFIYEQVRLGEANVCADELDIQLLPKVGEAWMPQGTQVEAMTPGTNEQYYLAGALEPATGTLPHGGGPRNTNGLFRNLW